MNIKELVKLLEAAPAITVTKAKKTYFIEWERGLIAPAKLENSRLFASDYVDREVFVISYWDRSDTGWGYYVWVYNKDKDKGRLVNNQRSVTPEYALSLGLPVIKEKRKMKVMTPKEKSKAYMDRLDKRIAKSDKAWNDHLASKGK